MTQVQSPAVGVSVHMRFGDDHECPDAPMAGDLSYYLHRNLRCYFILCVLIKCANMFIPAGIVQQTSSRTTAASTKGI